jgi:glycosyltransferase involved in cell wall biosynthesis
MGTAEVLLTVSGVIAPDIETEIAQGQRPRADYLEMAARFGADLIDYGRARQLTGRFGRLVERVGGPQLMLAWACFQQRNRYAVIFTDGEQIGLPLAWLCRMMGRGTARHLMIVHVLNVGKKMLLLDGFALERAIDHFFVYSTWQKTFIQTRRRVDEAGITFTPFMVDSDFFAPDQVVAAPQPMICAVGLEFRDYPTLMRAVADVPIDLVIAAGSPWSKRADTTQRAAIPANVTVRRFSQYALRQLYADCRFVVVPLFEVEFQAGVTTILEAMAMGKAVICTRTAGQTDVVVDGVTGLYVPPGDAAALRAAIVDLLAHPDKAQAMGEAGRRRVIEQMSLDCYTERLHQVVQQYLHA